MNKPLCALVKRISFLCPLKRVGEPWMHLKPPTAKPMTMFILLQYQAELDLNFPFGPQWYKFKSVKMPFKKRKEEKKEVVLFCCFCQCQTSIKKHGSQEIYFQFSKWLVTSPWLLVETWSQDFHDCFSASKLTSATKSAKRACPIVVFLFLSGSDYQELMQTSTLGQIFFFY